MTTNYRIDVLRRILSQTLMAVLLAAAFLIATSAEARLIGTPSPTDSISVRMAVHLPTGCIARVTLDDQQLIKATISDPDCLPDGMSLGAINERRIDFELTWLPVVR